jgi:protein CpxP
MRTALIVTLLGALSVPAFAQTAPTTAPTAAPTAPSTAAGAAAVGAMPGGPMADPNSKAAMARVEQHIAQMHDRLAITPAQQPQWDAFAAVMRDNAQRMGRSYADRASRVSTQTALDDMKNYAAISHEHADNVDRLLKPFEALYASMSPEQRVAADKTFQNFQRGPGAGKGRHR